MSAALHALVGGPEGRAVVSLRAEPGRRLQIAVGRERSGPQPSLWLDPAEAEALLDLLIQHQASR